MFEWNEIYSVGIKTIDEQHQQLFSIGNKIYDLLELNDGFDHYDEIMTIIDELKNYTEFHFQYEEDLLEKCGYSVMDLKLHKSSHKAFMAKAFSFDTNKVDLYQHETLVNLFQFITTWITHHILDSDKEYSSFIISALNK